MILGIDSPDYITSATSVVLPHKLGAKNAGTFDVGSFPTGLPSASGLIAISPGLRTVLVVAVYLTHKLADSREPRKVRLGFGRAHASPHERPLFTGN
jgi:3-oxoacyl-[acyl-carrier-protein] synthase-3